MRWCLLLTSWSLVLGGCDDDRPPPERGIGRAPAAAPPSPGELRARDPMRAPAPDLRPEPRVYVPGTLEVRRTEVVEGEVPARAGRDYASELRAAAGSLAGCGEVRATGELRIPLAARVTDNGVVVSATVGGPLSAEVRDCLRRRIEGHRFGPMSGDSRDLRAELVVQHEVTTTRTEETVEERVGWGAGFDLQPGQVYGSQEGAAIMAPAPIPIAPAPGSREIGGPSTNEVAPSGVTIMGPMGVPIVR